MNGSLRPALGVVWCLGVVNVFYWWVGRARWDPVRVYRGISIDKVYLIL